MREDLPWRKPFWLMLERLWVSRKLTNQFLMMDSRIFSWDGGQVEGSVVTRFCQNTLLGDGADFHGPKVQGHLCCGQKSWPLHLLQPWGLSARNRQNHLLSHALANSTSPRPRFRCSRCLLMYFHRRGRQQDMVCYLSFGMFYILDSENITKVGVEFSGYSLVICHQLHIRREHGT